MTRLRSLVLLLGLSTAGHAQLATPDREPAKDNSVAAELASFETHPGLEVSLFADESHGIAKPIAIQWDPRGRLWVLCTLAYAQLRPDQIPDDKLFILEDIDGDGRADQSTVFASGLDMPTGFALGHGGVYLAEGAYLVFLKDTSGDDRADERTVLLTGFGTGDTHQNISNFVFDSGGFLYFSQGLHALSNVETPWGVSRGSTAGFWRLHPRTLRLDPFCFPSMTSQNPCGIALDRWGALFLKSNGPHLCFATPGLIPTTHPLDLMLLAQVGATPGKSMGVDIVETTHFPDWLQNHAIIAGYFARQVSALPLVEEGSGFRVSDPIQLLTSSHESFRPVDIRMGPDGAIYVADWFNPVINHYQVSLRHPHRDYDHGRIWRLAAKGRPRIAPAPLAGLPPPELFPYLRSPERWTREQARSLLASAPPEAIADRLALWARSLNPRAPSDALALVEVAGILESHGIILPEMLDRLQQSPEPYARAVAARIMARAPGQVHDALGRLESLLRDPHPRPRLEAVIACANLPGAESARLALRALDAPLDKNLTYALTQMVHARSGDWIPALESGTLEFAQPSHLAFALEAYGGEAGALLARRALQAPDISPPDRQAFLRILARTGSPDDLHAILAAPHADSSLLDLLVQAAQTRSARPAPPFAIRLGELLQAPQPEVRAAAVRLAGLWRVSEFAGPIRDLALQPATPPALRGPALLSFARLRGKEAASDLASVAVSPDLAGEVRKSALEALALADISAAASTVVSLIRNAPQESDLIPLLSPVLGMSSGPPALTKALDGVELTPGTAQQIATALARLGRTDLPLTRILHKTLGRPAIPPGYDADRVEAIVAAVRSGQGDPQRGRAVYELPQLNCVSCHQIAKAGGILGPPLDTVGAGLPLDQIVESILWPARQLKEGYFATAVATVDGQIHTGYIEREDKSTSVLWLRDMATQELRPVSLHQVASRQGIGTLMPGGLADTLRQDQVVDLIAYLASLQK